ncbi:MAG: N-glycosylase/DNA lyase [Pyrobaculum sp.]
MSREVIEAIRHFGMDAVFSLERRDPQFVAVCKAAKRHGEEAGARLAMLNALVSYKLVGKGEEHWGFFGDYFSTRHVGNICGDFVAYLKASPYLRLGLESRKRRVLKLCGYVPDLENLKKTWGDISTALKSPPTQKTVVFAIKILNYVYMCTRGVDRPLPFEIPLPVDYRVAYLTWCAKLVDIPPEEAMRRQKEIQTTWSYIAHAAGIPPLHVDTLLWLAGRAVIYGENIHQIPEGLLKVFAKREECKYLSRSR